MTIEDSLKQNPCNTTRFVEERLREIATEEQKKRLRKIKSVPTKVKIQVYDGCNNPLAANQFHKDVSLYNLWEALLYVENSEPQHFKQGTALAAFQATSV